MRILLFCCFLLLSGIAFSQFAYIPNRNSNSISVINTLTNTVAATLPSGMQPQCCAVNRPLNRVYIANNGSSDVTVIDPCSNTVVATIPCPGPGIPAGMAVSPNGQRLYVAMFNSNKLHVINAATNTLITSITTATIGVSSPEACVVSPDNSRVYLTLFDENKLAVIDATTNTVLSYQNTDSRPTGVDVSNDGTKLYVGNQNTSSLIVYNTSTWARIATVSFGPISFGGPGKAAGVVLNHANTLVYVALQQTGEVKVISTATNTIVNTISVGARPFGLDIMHDDSRLYVSCVDANRVDVINTATNTNIQSIPVGQAPYSYGKFIIKRNIDSVRISYTQAAACRTYNFQGTGFTSGGAAIASWQWSFGDGNTANTQNPNHTYAADGTYLVKLVITDAFGCKDSATTSLLIDNGAALTVHTTPDTSICAQTNVQLQTTGATNYTWTPTTGLSNPTIANPIASPAVTTKYYVTGTSGTGCGGIDSVTVTINPLPLIITSPDTLLCGGAGSVQLNTSGGTNYFWFPPFGLSDPMIPDPVASPATTTQYIVTGFDSNGCTASDTVNIKIGFSVKSGLIVPSAFTPNGDGVNDCFGIRFYEGISDLEFRVFNRWGENVFYTTNPAGCWNGRFKGKINPGNYVYYLKAKTGCTGPLFIKGSVILMR